MSSGRRWSSGIGYAGFVHTEDRAEWIRDHSFASKQWMIAHVKYGDWRFREDGSFEIQVKELLPREVLTIALFCRHWPKGGRHTHHKNYVHVFHSHVIGRKKR